jgi:hypothetical protein
MSDDCLLKQCRTKWALAGGGRMWILHSWFAPQSKHWRHRSNYCRWSAYFSWSIIRTFTRYLTQPLLHTAARPSDNILGMYERRSPAVSLYTPSHQNKITLLLQLSRHSLTIHAMTCARQLTLPESRWKVHSVSVCDIWRSIRSDKITLYMKSTSGRGVDQESHPAQRLKKRYSYLYSPSRPSWTVLGWTLLSWRRCLSVRDTLSPVKLLTDFDQIRHRTCLQKLSIKRSSQSALPQWQFTEHFPYVTDLGQKIAT